MDDPTQPSWVIVSTSEESRSGENIMLYVKNTVNDISIVKMGFDWKSSGNAYPEDKRKWKMINFLVDDFFKKDGRVDEEVYKDVEEQVLQTVSFLFTSSLMNVFF